MQKQKAMEKDMTTRLQKGASRPRQILDVNMKNAKVNVDQLTKRINAAPEDAGVSAFSRSPCQHRYAVSGCRKAHELDQGWRESFGKL